MTNARAIARTTTAALLVLMGCSSPTPGTECTTFEDCTGGQECVEGQCRQICIVDYDCPIGETCQTGFCQPGTRGDGERGADTDTTGGDSSTGDNATSAGDESPGGDETLASGDDFVPSGDTANGDAFQGDTLRGDTLQGDTLQGDTLQGDTLQGDTLQGDTNVTPACATLTTSTILLQDPSVPTPNGWLCVSCGAADPFYRRYVVGEASAGLTGGTDTHSHDVTLADSGPAVGQTELFLDNGTNIGGSNIQHTHLGASGTTAVADHLPPYRNLKLIRPLSATTQIPDGVIVMLDTAAVPNGDFVRYSAQDGFYIRGEGVAGTGGAATHDDTFDLVNAGQGSGWDSNVDNNNCPASQSGHAHAISGTIVSDNAPPHVEIGLASVAAAGGTPTTMGIMALFDATPGAQWQVLSGTGGLLESDFLVGTASPDFSALGNAVHQPADTTFTSGPPDLTRGFRGQPGCVAANPISSTTHTHTHLASYTASDPRPPYASAIVAKLVACQ